MNPYIISTERLGLRNWKDSDILPFAEMNGDPEVMKYFPNTFSEAETRTMVKRIQSHFERHGFGLFAVENKSSGEFIGLTGFNIPPFDSYFTPCVEIGWRFKKESWGEGYATEAAVACLIYGFDNLHLQKIVSFTSPLNSNSEKLMKRIGMKYSGDFDHPLIPKDNILCRHVLYEISR
jgi:[ribosomal protein S5]-alanine N-acetyltransferase